MKENKATKAQSDPNPAYAELAAKLKAHRIAKEMSQVDFAAFLGIPYRTYTNYESGHRYPKNMEVVNQICKALNITVEDLLGQSGGYIVDANEKGGSRDRKRMEQMVTQLSAMFAGGEVDEESKDAAMAALNAVYWKNKQDNRQRFTPKKYRKDDDGDTNEDNGSESNDSISSKEEQ